MTDPDRSADAPADQPLNRAQRRAKRFGRADNRQDNLRPESDNNTGFTRGREGDAETASVREASAGRPDQDVVRQTGAGAGGAIESDDRPTGHEGTHLGNQPNS